MLDPLIAELERLRAEPTVTKQATEYYDYELASLRKLSCRSVTMEDAFMDEPFRDDVFRTTIAHMQDRVAVAPAYHLDKRDRGFAFAEAHF